MMQESDRRTAVVSLAVYPDTKEQWEQSARTDPNADSVSQFVRVAVSRYIHDRADESNSGLTSELGEQLTTVSAGQDQLEQHLDEIKGQLSDVRERVQGSTARPEIEDLAGDILELLPSESY